MTMSSLSQTLSLGPTIPSRLCWTGRESIAVTGSGGSGRFSRACDRRGRELSGSLFGPGSFYLVIHIATVRLCLWSIRPIRTSAINTGAPNAFGAAVGQGAWIAHGFTVLCFWTVPGPAWRESGNWKVGCGAFCALTGPTESQ